MAVSLPDYHRRPVYAMSISAPAARMTRERIETLGEDVLKIKKELSAVMGF